MKNSWDYKKGDLIKVEKLGWPIEIGVIIRCVGDQYEPHPQTPRKENIGNGLEPAEELSSFSKLSRRYKKILKLKYWRGYNV